MDLLLDRATGAALKPEYPILFESTVTFERLKAFIEQAMIKLGLPDADALQPLPH